MLNSMRDGAHSKIIKIFLFGLLVLATGGMVFTDVGGFFRDGMGVNTLATIGKETISGQEFDRALQRVISQQGMSAKQAYQYGLVDQVLQQEINTRLLKQAATKNGIYVGDAQVASQINQMLAPAMQGQKGSRREILRRILQNQGMGEQELINTIRHSMMSTVLQSTLQTGAAIVPRQEAVDLYRVRNETRNVEGFMLTHDSVKGVGEADENILKALYEVGKNGQFAIPESRTMTVAVLSEEQVKATLVIPDEDLQKEYDKSIASFTSPERRVIQQAVVLKEDDAKKIAEAVVSGKALKDAVKTVTGKDNAYNGEDTYLKAGLPKAIADASFSAALDQPVGPIKTALGYHVLVVKKVLAPDKKSFESVKNDIRKDLSSVKLSRALQDTANTIDDRLAGGEEIGKIAKEMNLKIETIGPVDKQGATMDKKDAFKDYAKDRTYILKTAFEMNEGESAPVMQLSDGRYVALHMDKIKERSARAYEDVKDELKKGWLSDTRQSMNNARATQLQQAVAGGSKTLAAAAADAGVSVQNFPGLKMIDPSKAIGPGGMAMIFDTTEGETVMAPTPDGYLIATVKTVNIPDSAKVSDADLKPIIEGLKKNGAEEVMMTYIKYLQGKTGVKINRNLLNQLYGPESGNPS